MCKKVIDTAIGLLISIFLAAFLLVVAALMETTTARQSVLNQQNHAQPVMGSFAGSVSDSVHIQGEETGPVNPFHSFGPQE